MDPTEPIDRRAAAEHAETEAETRAGVPRQAAGLPPAPAGALSDRYELLEVIGEGGMGTVHRARQRNPDREVALKLIRAGAASEKLLRRFHLEAELLGRLQHPGIAQIYEAGTIEAGSVPQPYFAMELVRGVPLDQFADEQSLGTRDRLELFVRIADAVQHAHERGIIHRDLKPGNVLVTPDGQPKVLDFGVARATDSDVQVTTIQTDIGQLIGTVPYMSPEQVTGETAQIGVRSDVYALGVVLYELLAGRLPYDLRQRMIHEAARMIREDDPTPLSVVDKTLRGDVETIVSKALEKEPPRRYQSAAELAADVRRYLADEPIVARAPSTMYQLAKFSRRHRGLVGGLVAVFVALIAGTIVSSVLAARAMRAEGVAAERLAESEATVDFLDGMLEAADPYQLGKDVTVREVLAESSKSIGWEFAERPLVAARLHLTIGNTFGNLGDMEAAVSHIGTAFELRRSVLGPAHADTLLAEVALATVHYLTGKTDEAFASMESCVERLTQIAGRGHPATIEAMTALANLHGSRMDGPSAEPLAREAYRLTEEAFGTSDRRSLEAAIGLATLLTDNGKFDEAESLFLETIDRSEDAFGENHPTTLSALTNLGLTYYASNDIERAIEVNHRALAISLQIHGELHVETTTVQANLAIAYRVAGETEKAEPLYRKALDFSMEYLGERNQATLIDMSNFGVFLVEHSDPEEGLQMLERSVRLHREVMGSEFPGTGITLSYYGRALQKLGRLEESAAACAEAYEIVRGTLGPEPPLVKRIGESVATVYEEMGAPDRAVEWRSRHGLPPPDTSVDPD